MKIHISHLKSIDLGALLDLISRIQLYTLALGSSWLCPLRHLVAQAMTRTEIQKALKNLFHCNYCEKSFQKDMTPKD